MTRSFLLGFLLVFTACSLDIPLEDEISGKNAINNPEVAREALNAAYKGFIQFPVTYSLLADDFMPTYLIGRDYSTKQLYYWNAHEIALLSDIIWKSHYHTIAQINTVLNSKNQIKFEDDNDEHKWETVEGEAYALKAMVYLELLSLYADHQANRGIILKDKLDLEFLKRSNIVDCEREINHLLEKAETLLKVKDFNPNYINYYTTLVLHARLMLLQENYEKAHDLTQEVIDAIGLVEGSLNASGYSSLWTNNRSNEKLFGYNNFTFPLTSFIENKEKGDYIVVSPEISFEERDIRKSASQIPFLMKKNGTDPLIRPLLGKYRTSVEDYEPKDINCIRLAEAYFIAAESYVRNKQGKKAKFIINYLLASRGASLVPEGLNEEELLEKILHEKRKEFVGEGLRFFDLKRLKQNVPRYNIDSESINKTISINDFRWIFPIPQSEIQQNKGVRQNPEWESIITSIN